MTFFIILLVVGLIVGIASGIAKAKKRKLMQDALLKAGADECFISVDDWTFIAISSSSKKVILGNDTASRNYSFDQIVSVEVCENGGSLTKTNRSSQLVAGALGAVAFGGVGAIIGGLSGSTRSSSLINSVLLKVIVDDYQHPNYSVTVFSSKKGEKRDSLAVKQVLSIIERLHARLVLAIRAASQPQVTAPRAADTTSSALEKLWSLRISGALTDEEFTAATRRLIGVAESKSTVEELRLLNSIEVPVTNTTELVAAPAPVTLTMVGCGNKIEAIKALRNAQPGLGLAAAKNLVDSIPTVLAGAMSPDVAQNMSDRLATSGVRCIISI